MSHQSESRSTILFDAEKHKEGQKHLETQKESNNVYLVSFSYDKNIK